MKKTLQISSHCHQQLLIWYRENGRPFPWRETQDPYSIWISETMLQQTTTKAVLPFYKKFMEELPDLESLALADLSQIYKLWAGLGYYSRARNLHLAAELLLICGGFPRTHEELSEFPGFGPYTSRAIASFGFDQNCGVLDGNVIRVLTRFLDLEIEWWKSGSRNLLQSIVDDWATLGPSNPFNQAMMELGATICTPKNPSCLLCPLSQSCEARRTGEISNRPLARPKRSNEIWIWRPNLHFRNHKVLVVKNHRYPILKGQWALPGKMVQVQRKPSQFSFKHQITHHAIYVQFVEQDLSSTPVQDSQWVTPTKLVELNPSQLIQKIIKNKAHS